MDDADAAQLWLQECADTLRKNLAHALRRQAEVDANPAPQRWEVEHARDAVTRAHVALAVLGVSTAMLETP